MNIYGFQRSRWMNNTAKIMKLLQLLPIVKFTMKNSLKNFKSRRTKKWKKAKRKFSIVFCDFKRILLWNFQIRFGSISNINVLKKIRRKIHKNITFNTKIFICEFMTCCFHFFIVSGMNFASLLHAHSKHFPFGLWQKIRGKGKIIFAVEKEIVLKFMNSGERAYVLVFYHLLHAWSFMSWTSALLRYYRSLKTVSNGKFACLWKSSSFCYGWKSDFELCFLLDKFIDIFI